MQIDWPRCKLPPLPDHITYAIFRLTDFETCLLHGRFEAAIDMFVPDEYTRKRGSSHPCVEIRAIYALLNAQQQKDIAQKALAKIRRQDKKLAKANRETVKHVRQRHVLSKISSHIACLRTKWLACQLSPGDRFFS